MVLGIRIENPEVSLLTPENEWVYNVNELEFYEYLIHIKENGIEGYTWYNNGIYEEPYKIFPDGRCEIFPSCFQQVIKSRRRLLETPTLEHKEGAEKFYAIRHSCDDETFDTEDKGKIWMFVEKEYFHEHGYLEDCTPKYSDYLPFSFEETMEDHYECHEPNPAELLEKKGFTVVNEEDLEWQ